MKNDHAHLIYAPALLCSILNTTHFNDSEYAHHHHTMLPHHFTILCVQIITGCKRIFIVYLSVVVDVS